jgi:hypothetical protein
MEPWVMPALKHAGTYIDACALLQMLLQQAVMIQTSASDLPMLVSTPGFAKSFRKPATFKAYLSRNCASEVVNVASEPMVVLNLRAELPASGEVTLCINSTYLEDTYQCIL